MLYTACKTGNVSDVQQILDDLAARYVSAETGESPADAGEIPTDDGNMQTTVSRLLCHRCRNNSTTLLHVASQFSHASVVRLLLQHGADPSLKYALFAPVILHKVSIELPAVVLTADIVQALLHHTKHITDIIIIIFNSTILRL